MSSLAKSLFNEFEQRPSNSLPTVSFFAPDQADVRESRPQVFQPQVPDSLDANFDDCNLLERDLAPDGFRWRSCIVGYTPIGVVRHSKSNVHATHSFSLEPSSGASPRGLHFGPNEWNGRKSVRIEI